ncbi:MAG: phosphatase PAP2 family protein [Paludibacteraceae bacterium]|nr:phosphatase PAP2 family protein [Paludibacteraceae bacterium]
MLEQLITWDKSLFLLVNSANIPFFDHFFWFFTQKFTWIPLYIVLLIIFYKTNKKECVWIIIGIVLSVVLADQIASSLLKPLVARYRPSHDVTLTESIHLINSYKGGLYGFVSSHAANSFCFALFTALFFKNRWFCISIFSWALLNSYSRIYIGVHFPLDVIVGALVGMGSATIGFAVLNYTKPLIVDTYKEKPISLRLYYLLLGGMIALITLFSVPTINSFF